MNRYWGLNCLGHDASLCVVENNKVLFHELTSKYSGIKNDEYLNDSIIKKAFNFGEPNLICYYENPWKKKTRQIYSGEWNKALSLLSPKTHLYEHELFYPIHYGEHHKSHAAYGYYTSEFDDALIVVADAIGEWETLTVWQGENNKLTKLYSRKYPYSLGLFYSAFTKLAGMQPMLQEGEFMQLSKHGNAKLYERFVRPYLKKNLHKGIKDWSFWGDVRDLAASVQKVFEDELIDVVEKYKHTSKNIVIMGGCAYNSFAVEKINEKFAKNHKVKFPGDSSSSIGAVAAFLKQKINVRVD